MKAAIVVAACVLVGCEPSSDPCAGVAGTCLGVTITSTTVTQVDTLQLTASGAFSGTRTSAEGHASPLPLRVAVHYPSSASGAIHVAVAASLGGMLVGQGTGDTTIAPGKHSSLTVTLLHVASSFDMATSGGDMTGSSVDLAGSDGGGTTGDMAQQPCTPGATSCADANTLATCNGSGFGSTPMACPYGCIATGTAHCGAFVPTAPVMASDLNMPGLPLTMIPAGSIIHTDTGAIDGVRPAHSAAEPVNGVYYEVRNGMAIFIFGSLTVPNSATNDTAHAIQADGANALALVSVGDVNLLGVLDLRPGRVPGQNQPPCTTTGTNSNLGGGLGGGNAAVPTSGPGGGMSGGTVGQETAGGGGGGYGDHGGTANNTPRAGGMTNLGGIGGAAFGLGTAALSGGSGGGSGTAFMIGSQSMPTGGAGGALVYIVSGTKIVVGDGVALAGINVGGCGGISGPDNGAGGGSGGGLLLNAPVVTVSAKAVLASNGGGGGGGGVEGSVNNGGNGTLDATAAPGGATGVGGAGGAAGATAGGPGTSGSGGGAVGRIRFATQMGMLSVSNSAILSPSLSDKVGSDSPTSAILATFQ